MHCGGTNIINGQFIIYEIQENITIAPTLFGNIITAIRGLKQKTCAISDTPIQIIQIETNAVSNISQPSFPRI